MKYVKCKIVILPTEKDNCILRSTNTKALYQFKEKNKLGSFNRFHLYFLSDEEIKEGDWFININAIPQQTIQQACENGKAYVNCSKFSHYREHCKKIIATTDESLKVTCPNKNIPYACCNKEDFCGIKLSLPRPSNEFLKKYCELGGIDEVLVEVEKSNYNDWIKTGTPQPECKLKVAPDNTIIIKPVESEFYTREEVINLFHKWLENYHQSNETAVWKSSLDNWIKKNLK